MSVKKIIFGVLCLTLLVVILQNTEVTSFQFLFWRVSMSRIILVPLLIAIGFVGGFLIGRSSWHW